MGVFILWSRLGTIAWQSTPLGTTNTRCVGLARSHLTRSSSDTTRRQWASGQQNLSNETYKIRPEVYVERVEAFAAEFQATGDDGAPLEEDGVPVVRPPAGGDAYILARLWEFWPILELKKGESYRVHLSSADWQHGFSLQPTNINISVHPGYEHIITLTPTESGTFGIVCNEFCGIGHHKMVSKLYVVDK